MISKLLTLLLIAVLTAVSYAETRPNVLLIVIDDLNDWILHPEDHPTTHSPQMDRLRANSLNFSNAHVVVPVCGPSRKALFSGLNPDTSKAHSFKHWKQEKVLKDCVPIPLHFRNNGYNVYGTGKLFHEGKGGDFYTEFEGELDYGPWPSKPRKRDNKSRWFHPNLVEEFQGLNLKSHLGYSYGPLSNVPHHKADPSTGRPESKTWFHTTGEPFKYVNDEDRDLMGDEVYANFAIDVLGREHEKPFYLSVGFIRPHTPLFAPQKYFDMYPLDSITLPPMLEGDLDDVSDELLKRFRFAFEKYDKITQAGLLKETIQAYLACVTFVDDQVGRVMEALENSPYADNTIVILTSDHGYHLGEKEILQKFQLWEESTRVPFFVHIPGGVGNGETCTIPINQVDLYPTLIDLCGLPANPNEGHSNLALEGHSLRPLLENPKAEEWSGPSVSYTIIDGRHQAVRGERYRYILTKNGAEELYDHQEDPHEWHNVADMPEYAEIKNELRAALLNMKSGPLQ